MTRRTTVSELSAAVDVLLTRVESLEAERVEMADTLRSLPSVAAALAAEFAAVRVAAERAAMVAFIRRHYEAEMMVKHIEAGHHLPGLGQS